MFNKLSLKTFLKLEFRISKLTSAKEKMKEMEELKKLLLQLRKPHHLSNRANHRNLYSLLKQKEEL